MHAQARSIYLCILYRVIMDAHHAHAHNSCRPDAALYSSPPLWRDSPRLPEEEWGTQAHRCWGIAMSSDLQVPFQTRKPGARRYTNFIVRNHYILAPGRETVRETSKSCVSRSNRESWEACKYMTSCMYINFRSQNIYTF